MLYEHDTLSDEVDEGATMEFPCEQSALSDTGSEVSIEEGKVSREASVLSNITGKVSTNKGEAIPPLGDENVGDGKGLKKTWWSAKLVKDP